MLRKTLILLYAGGAYLLAMANIAYIVGFLAGFGVPKGVNDGTPGALLPSVALNLGLIWLFGLHHSATARRWFKARWTRLVPPSLERATYLYMTAIATALLVAFWTPVPVTLWHVESDAAAWAIRGAYLSVWAMMFAATFQIGHLGFFGLAHCTSRPPRRSSSGRCALSARGWSGRSPTRSRQWLRRMSEGRVRAAATGLAAALLLQSSTAVALFLAAFLESGALLPAVGLAALLGADVGSALVAQLLILRPEWITPLLLLSGSACS
jgi:hypothetical protein